MSEEAIIWIAELLPFVMLGLLAVLLFSGLPVAMVLFGLGTTFTLIGVALGEMEVAALLLIPDKLVQSIRGSLFYPAVAMLLFMGVALERSGIAHDMLRCIHLLTGRLRAGMIIAVLVIGVVLAPAAGIVGASVVTIALIALPAMLRAGYSAPDLPPANSKRIERRMSTRASCSLCAAGYSWARGTVVWSRSSSRL